MQDDWRASSKLTLNLGLRWDVYPPWIEIDDRQSNFDETTGQFVVASDDATIGGVEVGRYLQTYSKGDFGPRVGFAYDLAGDGKTLVRGGFGVFWNFTPGGTQLVEGAEPAVPAVDGADADADAPYGVNLLLKDGLPAPTGVDPTKSAGRQHAVDLRSRLPRRVRAQVEPQRAAAARRPTTWSRPRMSGSQGRNMVIKVDINQAPPVVGVSDCERQPAVHQTWRRHAVA